MSAKASFVNAQLSFSFLFLNKIKKDPLEKNMFPMCEGFHKRDDGRTSAACVLGNATRLKEHLAGYADTEFSFAEPNPPSSFSSSSSSVH